MRSLLLGLSTAPGDGKQESKAFDTVSHNIIIYKPMKQAYTTEQQGGLRNTGLQELSSATQTLARGQSLPEYASD